MRQLAKQVNHAITQNERHSELSIKAVTKKFIQGREEVMFNGNNYQVLQKVLV